MEHLDSPYFVSAEAQDYVTLHADILDNTAEPLPQMQTNAALTLSNHKSNTPMFVLANSIGKQKKIQSLLVNRTPQLLNLALIYTRLYPFLFPPRRVPRLQPQTSRNKNNFPIKQLPRPSPSPLFLPLSPKIYLTPIQLPKLTFPH